MIIYIVVFPKNSSPRKIAYKSYDQALKVCENIKISRKSIEILYLEEDENELSFNIINILKKELNS